MVRTKQQRRRDRRRADVAVPPVFSLVDVVNVDAGTLQVTVTFSSFVQIAPSRLPTSWTFGTTPRTITGIVSSTGTVYVFSVSGSVAAAQDYSIGDSDPAARTPTGGYVAASTGTMT